MEVASSVVSDNIDETVVDTKVPVEEDATNPAEAKPTETKADAKAATKANAPGRKPGRPRKQIENVPIEIHGVMNKPSKDSNVVELVYSNPTLFKKICNQLKAYNSTEIDIVFTANMVQFITKDFGGKSDVYINIDCRRLNSYYCKQNLKISTKRIDLEDAFTQINKHKSRTTFIIQEGALGTLNIINKDNRYNNDEHYEIEVISKGHTCDIQPIDMDKDYPISFELESKSFKDKIASMSKISDTFTIQKVGDGPLEFTSGHGTENKKVTLNDIYTDPSKINLISRLEPNVPFTVSTGIKLIQPIASSCAGDLVRVSVDKFNKIGFTTLVDKKDDGGYVCTIKVFTEINGYKK